MFPNLNWLLNQAQVKIDPVLISGHLVALGKKIKHYFPKIYADMPMPNHLAYIEKAQLIEIRNSAAMKIKF